MMGKLMLQSDSDPFNSNNYFQSVKTPGNLVKVYLGQPKRTLTRFSWSPSEVNHSHHLSDLPRSTRQSGSERFALLLLLLLLFSGVALGQIPTITDFNPKSGPVGTIVTISGTNFDPINTNNVVYFGAVKGSVTSGTSTGLTVTVPSGATFEPITVTNIITGLTAYSAKPFAIMFPSIGILDAGSFSPKLDFGAANSPHDIKMGDIDGDGKSDLALACSGSNAVSVVRNTSSDGILSFAANADFAAMASPQGVAISDIDGDGKLDLAVVNWNGASVSLFRSLSSPGTISFAGRIDSSTVGRPERIAVGDLDRDGKPDLVIGNGNGQLSIFRNTSSVGNISFAVRIDIPITNGPTDVAVADIDGDGNPDIIETNYGSNTVAVLRNISTLGNLSFESPVSFVTAGYPGKVAVTDLDGDDKNDIAVSTQLGKISILRNTSSGTTISFAAKTDITTTSEPHAIAAGDLDGDGKPDIVITFAGDVSTIVAYLNSCTPGNISFKSPANYIGGWWEDAVAIGDLNGDGKPDIAAANMGGNNGSALRNRIPVDNQHAGLVAFYPFSGNTADSSGDGNHGTNNGATLTADRFAKPAMAYDFDGTSASITCGNPASLNINSAISMSAWIRPRSLATSRIVSKGGANAGYELLVSNPNVVLALNQNNLSTVDISSYLNQWLYIVGTWDGSATRIYVNGVLRSTVAYATQIVNSSNELVIGQDASLSPEYFNGAIDDIRIYNRALRSGEIDTLYHAGGWALPPPTITDFSPKSGSAGTTITITGTNFNPISIQNVVYFGAVKGSVTSGTSTGITVTVPTGATYAPITVTDTTTKLTAFSTKPFIPKFTSIQQIDSTSFAAKMDFGLANGTYDVAFGDINGDGKPELLTTNFGNATFSVLTNTSSGNSLSFAAGANFPSAGNPQCVTLGDIDGDGNLDVITANYGVSISRNTTTTVTPSFAAKLDLTGGSNATSVAIGDIDGDGRPDLAVGNYTSADVVSVLQNTSIGGVISFAPKIDFTTGTSSKAIVLGDIDGDGKPDLVVTNDDLASISVLRNTSTNGVISFASNVDISTRTWPGKVVLSDVDGDGKLDVFAGCSGYVSVLRNTSTTGAVSFAVTIDYAVGNGSVKLAAGDLDGDGKPDIAATAYNNNRISVFRNISSIGNVSFEVKVTYPAGSLPMGVAICDANGDGMPDIATGYISENVVSVFRNQIPENIPPAAPTGLVAFKGNGKVTLKWNKNTEADMLRYRIYRSTAPNPTAKIDSTTGGINDTSKVISGLVNGTLYYFRVTAVDTGGMVSGYSNNASAAPGVISLCVSTTGNDGNLGTPAAPFRNIQTALIKAGSGDTVKVAAGSYNETLVPSAQVTLKGGYSLTFTESSRDLIAQKTTLGSAGGEIIRDNQSSTIDGFVFDGTNVPSNYNAITISGGYATITHNVLTKSHNSGCIVVRINSGAGALVQNNTIVQNALSGGGVSVIGISIVSSANPSTLVQNNIITTTGIGIVNDLSSSIADYNCIDIGGGYGYHGTYTAPGPHDISSSPKLVYPAGGDYRLKGGSPCIDAGNPTDPIGEEPIPNGNRIDIGAYGGTKNTTKSGWNPVTCVSTNGSDANDGSAASPYLTIQYALMHALGDTIKVATGTYAEGLTTFSPGILRGGYPESFDEKSRNIHQYRTTIQAVGSTMWNDAFGVDVDGFYFDGMSTLANVGLELWKPVTISHNVILNVLTGAFVGGIKVHASATVVNNVLYHCAYGFWLESEAIGGSFKNNIIANSTSYGVFNAAADGLLTYNCYYNNSLGNYSLGAPYRASGIGEITANPLFRAPASLDFRLQSNSPCINAGDPDVSYNDPDGSRSDMGVFYYDSPPAAPQNLTATAGEGSITLNWTQNTEPDLLRYRIFGGTSPNPTTQIDSTLNGAVTSRNYSGLQVGVTRYYRLKAVDNTLNESIYSNEVNATPIPSPLQVDSLALVALYNSTNGLNWTNKTNWLTGAVSTWFGITVSNGRVTNVYLNINNLVGSIPSEIGNLDSLRYLQLAQNQLTGPIPQEIWGLTGLTRLDLGWNALSGTLPAEVGNLARLLELKLEYNQFTGELPLELYTLSQLNILDLAGNSFTGSIHANIGNLTSLENAYLNLNQLTGSIPSSLSYLTKLQELLLNGNSLSGAVPIELWSMTQLRTLNLSSNQLNGVLPQEIGRMDSLSIMYVGNNQFSGGVPDSIVRLQKLRVLDIQNNHFDRLPNLGSLPNLTDLNVSGNNLTFADLEPNAGVASNAFTYIPQDSVGTERTEDVLVGCTVTLTTSVGGTANQYQWMKDNVDIPTATGPTLIFPSVTSAQDGKYICKVSNTIITGLMLYTRPVTLSVHPNLPGEYLADANTVLLMHMNETSGSTVSDASSFGNNGQATGTTIVDGRFGKARSYGGSDGISIASNASLNPSSGMTVEAWAYLAGGTGNDRWIVEKDDGNSARQFLLSASDVNRFRAHIGTIVSLRSFDGNTVIQLNRWYHVAMTYDNSILKLYVNGLLDGSITPNEQMISTTQPVTIGGGGILPFSGLIDEVRISNVIRSPQGFNLQLPPVNLAATPSGSTVNLNWQNGGGAVPLMRYKIYRGTDSTTVSMVDSTTATSKSNTPGSIGTYYYRISAVDSTGFEGAMSYAAKATVTGVNTAPAAPQNLTATAGNGQVTLKWSKNIEADFLKYRVYMGTDSVTVSLKDSTSASISDTLKTITGLTNGTKYYFRVSALDDARLESGKSYAVGATPSVNNLITFQVKMNIAMQKGRFDPASDTVIVRGTFNSWVSNTDRLSDPNADSIYTGTINVGTADPPFYKFVIRRNSNDDWEGHIDNRIYTPTGSPQTLPPVYFDDDSIYIPSLFGEYRSDANTVLLMHMNETSGSTVSDASSFSNNGIATGTSIVDGKFAKARSFNGTSDFISIPDADIFTLSTNPFTIETWAIFLSTPPQCALMGHDDGPGAQNKWILLAGQSLSFHVYSTTVQSQLLFNMPWAPTIGRWYHIAVSRSGNTFSLYVDGTVVSTDSRDIDIPNPTASLTLGNAEGEFFFNGMLDEVRISNVARSPQEFNLQLPPVNLIAIPNGTIVSLSWENGGGAVPLMKYRIYRGTDSMTVSMVDSTAATSKANTVGSAGTYYYRISAVDSTGFEGEKSWAVEVTIANDPSLVAFYPFNGNTQDESGNGNHGINNGATLTTDRFGNAGKAYEFNGSNNWINCGSSLSLDINNPFQTISVWIKPHSLVNGKIISKTSGMNGYEVDVENSKARFILNGVAYIQDIDISFFLDQWVYLAARADGVNAQLYINGVLQNSQGFGGPINSTPNSMFLGQSSNTNDTYFNGIIDDIRIYKRALTEEEIQALYLEGGWNGVRPPTAPVNLFASAGNAEVTLNWNKNTESDFLRYRIYQGTSSPASTLIDSTTSGSSDTTKIITSLTNGTTYFFRITAVNTSQMESGYSNEASATPTSGPILSVNPTSLAFGTVDVGTLSPEKTYSLFGANLTPASGNIAVTAPSGFEVSLSSGAGFASSMNVPYASGILNTTTYVRFNPTAATTYSGNISNAGGGAATKTLSVSGTGNLSIAAPTTLTATVMSSSRIDLSWIDNSTNEDKFKIERKIGDAGTYSDLAEVGASIVTYSNIELTDGTRYVYRVKAFSTTLGSSAYSNESGANTPLNAPTNLAATAASAAQVQLSWQDNSGNESNYEVERSAPNSNSGFTNIATIAENLQAYQDATVSSSTTYWYRVRATNSIAGVSAYSNADSAQVPAPADITPPAAPINLAVNPAGWTKTASWLLSWTNPTDPSDIAKAWYTVDALPTISNPGTSVSVSGLGSTPSIQVTQPVSLAQGPHTVYLYLEDGAPNQNKDPNNAVSVVVWYDSQSPLITHDFNIIPEVTVDVNGNATPSISIAASASDNSGSGVQSMVLEYRRVGESATSSAAYVAPYSVSSARQIPSPTFVSSQKAIGVDYRIAATDSAGNTSSTIWYSISVRNAPSIVITTPTPLPAASSYPSTELVKAYRLFSVPYDLDNKTPSFIVSSLGNHNANGVDYYNWRLQRYVGASKQDFKDFESDASAFAPGKGFFLIVRDPQKTITVGSNKVVRAEVMNNTGIQLSDGWNLVGTPLNITIPFDSLAFVGGTYMARASFSGDGPHSGWWMPGDTKTDQPWNTLKPWEGLAIKVNGVSTLKFKMQGPQFSIYNTDKKEVTGKSILAKQAADAKEQPAWMISVDAYRFDIGMCAIGNGVGMARDASEGTDRFDSFMPPFIGDRNVALYFMNPDGAMMRDIRPLSAEGSIWDMRVVTGDAGAKVKLQFNEAVKISDLTFDAYLLDLDRTTAHNLRETSSLDINSGSGTRNFRLIVGKKAFIEQNNAGIELAPSAMKLFANYPNPFNPETSIRYTIPNTASMYAVTLRIFNMLGQEIETLVQQHQRAGYYEVLWDARRQSSGVYFYELSIWDGSKKYSDMKKMILVK